MIAQDQITVVVADDSELVRDSIAHAIHSHPKLTLIACANDGQTALELIRELRPTAATLADHMPPLDAAALLGQLRAERIPTRVLVLSAGVDGALTSRMLLAGAAGCLSKDDSSAEIAQALIDAASGRTTVSLRLELALAAHLQALNRLTQARLSRREHEVLELASHGKTAKQTAQ